MQCSYNNSNEYDSSLSNNEILTVFQAIDEIKKSFFGEEEDINYYSYLLSLAPNDRDKRIINSILEDEVRHDKILKRIYYDFTNQILPSNQYNKMNYQNRNYKFNLENALIGETNAVKKYRKILGAMPSGGIYTLVMSIMTDELIHADKLNLLISTN